MDYKTLPFEERITLASQYALLLVADNKPVEELLRILRNDFNLRHEILV